MKSWAVTRGPSLVPGEKRLAVQVEDHPIDYNKFEGTIPQGEYGGGTVMVWDRGRWQPEGDPHKGLRKGHLAFRARRREAARRLASGAHAQAAGREARQLAADQAARRRRAHGRATRISWRSMPLSVKPAARWRRSPRKRKAQRKSKAEAQDGRPRRQEARRPSEPSADDTPRRSASAARRKSGASRRRRSAAAQAAAQGAAARTAPPCPPSSSPALPRWSTRRRTTSAWMHEIKFDGYRIQARLDHGKVKLMTRKGLDWTRKFPERRRSRRRSCAAKTALIDGELVVEDAKGISRFSLLAAGPQAPAATAAWCSMPSTSCISTAPI